MTPKEKRTDKLLSNPVSACKKLPSSQAPELGIRGAVAVQKIDDEGRDCHFIDINVKPGYSFSRDIYSLSA